MAPGKVATQVSTKHISLKLRYRTIISNSILHKSYREALIKKVTSLPHQRQSMETSLPSLTPVLMAVVGFRSILKLPMLSSHLPCTTVAAGPMMLPDASAGSLTPLYHFLTSKANGSLASGSTKLVVN